MNAYLTTEQREMIIKEIAEINGDIWCQEERDENVVAMRKMNNTQLREYIQDEIVDAGLETSVTDFLNGLK